MAKNYYDITLALAGVCQAARLVQQLAHQGHCDSDALHVSLNSIIDLDPESTLAVFGGSEANLRLGLETLLGVLNTSSRQGLNAELTRYTLSLMVLERKLAARKGAMDTLGNRIAGLHRQLEHFAVRNAAQRHGGHLCRCDKPAGAAYSGDRLPCRAAKPAGAGESSLSAAGGYSRRGALASGGRRTSAAYVFP